MSTPHLKVLVAGATGRQGSAVAQWLLANGHDVVALSRNLAHPEAMRLMRRGARLAWAAFDDRPALEESMHGCDGLFLMTPHSAGAEDEVRYGTTMAEAAAAAGVGHVVFSSMPGAAQPTGIPHLDSKHAIERRLAELEVPHTVVAPAFFMERFTDAPHIERFREGRLVLPYPPGRKLQQIAVADVARFVTVVFEAPDDFLGERIPIAGDELSGIEMAATLARVMTRPIVYEEQPLAAAWASDSTLAGTFEHLQRAGPAADVSALRATYDIGWHTLDGWARQQQWHALLEAPTSLRHS
ncbi:MAG: NmrA/HSCARG family protein [Longimicrobiales bacterium]